MSSHNTDGDTSTDSTSPSGLPVIAILVGFGSVASLMGQLLGVTSNPATAVYVFTLGAALLVLLDYRRRCRLAADDG